LFNRLRYPSARRGLESVSAPPAVQVLDTDLWKASLESLTRRVEHIQKSVSDKMAALGLWELPPNPEVHDNSLNYQTLRSHQGLRGSQCQPCWHARFSRSGGPPKLCKRVGRSACHVSGRVTSRRFILMIPLSPSEEGLCVFQLDKAGFDKKLKLEGGTESTTSRHGANLWLHSRGWTRRPGPWCTRYGSSVQTPCTPSTAHSVHPQSCKRP